MKRELTKGVFFDKVAPVYDDRHALRLEAGAF